MSNKNNDMYERGHMDIKSFCIKMHKDEAEVKARAKGGLL